MKPDSATPQDARSRGGGRGDDPPLSSQYYPEALSNAEHRLRESSRERDQFGAAFSGGGIRSATFCLGVLQAMAKRHILDRMAYLSTVSGGGYIGAFLGALYTNGGGPDRVKEVLGDPFSPPLRWLRENGRYLAPNGAGDLLSALAEQLRNWVSALFVMCLFALSCFLGLELFREGLSWLLLKFALPGHDVFGPVARRFWWWSPFLLLPAVGLCAAVLLGCCFWLTPARKDDGSWFRPWRTAAFLVLVSGWIILQDHPAAKSYLIPGRVILVGAGLALLTQVLLLLVAKERVQEKSKQGEPHAGAAPAGGVSGERADAARLVRSWLTSGLAWTLLVTAVFLLIGLIDSLGFSLYLSLKSPAPGFVPALTAARLLWLATAVTGLLSLASRLKGAVGTVSPGSTWRLPLSWAATALAMVVATLILINVNLLDQALVWNFEDPFLRTRPLIPLVPLLILAIALSWLLGRRMHFLNKSSLQQLYGSRLARAYLGASNPRRQGTPEGKAVTRLVPGDDLWWDRYAPERHGGPLHLINLTVNETCSARSQIEQRDRKVCTWPSGRPGSRSAAPITPCGK